MNKFVQKFKVELSDITPNFGLKPTSVFKYYQETFARYCAKYGVAGYDVYKMGLKWVFGQSIAEFFDVIPVWNEEIIATVRISYVKKLRIYINFELETARGLVAKGQSIAYILDLETSRPQCVDKIIEHFNIDISALSLENISFDFIDDVELISSQEHKITISNLDYNNHTNNISYLDFCFADMPENYINDNYPKVIEVKYLQETFLNDVLKCEIYQNDSVFSYKILNAKDDSLVCLVKSIWKDNNMTPDAFFDVLDNIKSKL